MMERVLMSEFCKAFWHWSCRPRYPGALKGRIRIRKGNRDDQMEQHCCRMYQYDMKPIAIEVIKMEEF